MKVLPRHARPQPRPFLVDGGDCGACALGGLVDMDVADVYATLRRGQRATIGWHDMRDALWAARSLGLVDRTLANVPSWAVFGGDGRMPFGSPAWLQAEPWFQYVQLGVDAGCYALCTVAFDGQGPLGPDGGGGCNHWVLVRGWRVADEHPRNQILVSCSATDPEGSWVGAHAFLKDRGGFNAILARPAPT